MGKLSMSERAAKVNSVLEYLQRYERHAELSNRRNERNHFQTCWTMVFSAFYGDFHVPRYIKPLEQNTAELLPEEPQQRPKWFIDKYSRPMRKVIKHGKGFDVLSCGHKIASFDSTAKHRRCKECKGLPPAESPAKKRRVRAYEVCKKIDKALRRIPRKLPQSVGHGGRVKAGA